MKIGPTGKFPYGKADADDEGELAIAIAADHRAGIVRIDLGGPISWVGMPSVIARNFAQLIIEKADELDRKKS